ncbi:MAG: hypothetical protein MJZ94_08160 [Bacteroidales bacterium]|nr:hypothetical protein [Bacteroidales bacterium]
MTAYEWITTLAVPVTGIASWLAATRLRQNKTICEMQETVFKLVEENKRVYAELTEARMEIVNLSTQVARLTLENAELKQLIENITS